MIEKVVMKHQVRLYILGAVVGVVSGLVAVGFRWLILVFSILFVWIPQNIGLAGWLVIPILGGLIVAFSSSILYGLLLCFNYYDLIQPFSPPLTLYPAERESLLYTLYNVIVNSGAFFLVAFLSSFVSEQARKGRV